MEWNTLRKRARELGVNTKGLKKPAVIRAVQSAEGNFDCFGRAADYCDQVNCAWRSDCLTSARRSRRKSA